MDILRKMFKIGEDEANKDKDAPAKDEFQKPQWCDESETDNEIFDDRKFAFQMFTNPVELQKHFEHQMQQIMEAMNQFEENGEIPVEKNLKEGFLKPGYEKLFRKELEDQTKSLIDTDLDGEIYADDVHSLMQKFTTQDGDLSNILPRNDNKPSRRLFIKQKLTDEEKILGKIHGTLTDEETVKRPRLRPDIMTPMTPLMPRNSSPFGGVFEDAYKGPKMFSQSVMTKSVRKPDGTYETTKVQQDSEGNKTTTITRTINGKTETVVTYEGAAGKGSSNDKAHKVLTDPEVYSDRNIAITKQGYAVPRNIW